MLLLKNKETWPAHTDSMRMSIIIVIDMYIGISISKRESARLYILWIYQIVMIFLALGEIFDYYGIIDE